MNDDPMTHDAGQGKPGTATIIAVNFRQDTLFAIERPDGVYVAIKPICDAVGVTWRKQLERLKRDPILSEGITMVVIPSPGGPQETTCLRLDLVHGWLFTMEEGRVKDEETRQRVLTYKRDCYAVLFQHFYGRRNVPGDEVHEANAPKVRMITEVRHTFGVPAAKQLWLKLQLPVVPAMFDTSGQGDLFDDPEKKVA